MMNYSRILVPIDHSVCAEAALQHALRLAEYYHADLEQLHVTGAEHLSRNGMQAAESVDTVSVRRITLQHPNPALAIVDYADERDVDLIIMGMHGDDGASRFLNRGPGSLVLGRTADQVVRRTSRSVFTVGLRCGRQPGRIRRLLVPVDFSDITARVLEQAVELARVYRADLDVLHVVEEDSSSLSTPQEAASDQRSTPILDAQDEMHQLVRWLNQQEVSATARIVRGRPDREIRGYATRNAIGLIVLGAHSRIPGGTGIGSVSEHVMQRAPCPVFTLRRPRRPIVVMRPIDLPPNIIGHPRPAASA